MLYDYSHMKLSNSALILAVVAFLLFGRSSATLVQEGAELGLSVDSQQKLSKKLHKAIRWDKTRSGLS